MTDFDSFGAAPASPSPTSTSTESPRTIPLERSGTEKLAAALALAQGDIPPPSKNKTVDFMDNNNRRVFYKYADLADVIDCIRGALAKNGLSVVHLLEQSDFSGRGGYGMRTQLLHSSGQSISTWYPLPDPLTIRRVQEFGSILTYARRYSLTALLGIASEEDDDGDPQGLHAEEAGKKPRQAKASPPSGASTGKDGPVVPKQGATPPGPAREVSDAQLKRLHTIKTDQQWSDDQLKTLLDQKYKLASTKDLTRAQYDEICQTMQGFTFAQALVHDMKSRVGSSPLITPKDQAGPPPIDMIDSPNFNDDPRG